MAINLEETGGCTRPLITVIVLNFNGTPWLERCLRSLRSQTISRQLELILADNNSPDGSAQLAEKLLYGWPNAKVMQHGKNLGFCEGNNRAAKEATGDYLFFLNNDTWLEGDCLEKLIAKVQAMGAQAGTPIMLNYEDMSVQSAGGQGFDIFGLMSLARPTPNAQEIFVVGGCSYLIRRDLFERIGGFDSVFYMYADEYDLSWRVWIAGAKAVIVPEAQLHHRGAASVNPSGGGKVVEMRTSDTKRFYTNRNCLLLLLKNCRHILLLMVPLQLTLLVFEAVVSLAIFRRLSFVRRAYWDAVMDCARLTGHIVAERKRIRTYRKRGDLQMLRFLCWRLNRWDEFRTLLQHGVPHLTRG